MHTYTPSKAKIREEWNRKIRLKNRKVITQNDIPSNSASWNQCEYKTLHDLIVVVDNIAKVQAQWQPPSKNS